jgi:hypothetical protein
MPQDKDFSIPMPQDKDYFCIMRTYGHTILPEVNMKTGETVIVIDIHDNNILREMAAIEDGFAYVSRPEEVGRARIEAVRLTVSVSHYPT